MPIQIEGLTHTYSPGSPFQATAIHDVTCTLNNGEFIGVVGHTGSGKSTLVQHLNGLLTPSQGRVLVDGLDTADKASRKAIRQKVGLVFQYPEHQLFEETVARDVAFGPKNLGLAEDEIQRRVNKALTLVGLDPEEIGPRSPFELSGGQMRRAAIAGILAMEPEYLVLDEPTAGLDPMGRDSILNMVKTLHAQGNVTVIMVTHSMDDISRLAD
ncbi:MAG: energy-coupling factor transporter ATPase, partial [Clostridia bacterium]|nr:energy-coupling factor transporter ATPase [Clostridia bacterium]